MQSGSLKLSALLTGCLVLACSAVALAAPASCPRPGSWLALRAEGSAPAPRQVFDDLAQRSVVLLGENHDNAEHHRWQLHVIAGLHARVPRLVLGFEMFPRSVQAVLDQWTAGEISEAQLLERTRWSEVWGHDPQLYLPIFHFARMHRLPMVALNVDRRLVRRVSQEGWGAIPSAEREGVSNPAPPAPAYVLDLYQSWLTHLPPDRRSPDQPGEKELREPGFVRFVESMQLWDRAMAEGIAQRLGRDDGTNVVAIMGSGHLRDGYGVPHQLRDLGVRSAAVALPWDVEADCAGPGAGASDYLFGVAAIEEPLVDRPRLGVRLDRNGSGVVVQEVVADSVAQQAGVQAGDVIGVIAGVPVQEVDDVLAVVRRQAPGTWLPLTVQRGGQSLDLVARFPPRR